MARAAPPPAGARAAGRIPKSAEAQRADTARAMRKPTLRRTVQMAVRALKRADKTIAQVLKLVPPPAPIACKANCPWCCHIRLTAAPPEILAVLDHIHRTFMADDLAALKRKVANIDAFTRGKDGDARAQQRLPCPLLKDGSCSVHAVRPLSCRAVVSVDVTACIRSYETRMQAPVPQHELHYQAANAMGYALYAGLVDAGFAVEDVEMNAALAIGLDDPAIGKRWLAGEDVFAPAKYVRTG